MKTVTVYQSKASPDFSRSDGNALLKDFKGRHHIKIDPFQQGLFLVIFCIDEADEKHKQILSCYLLAQKPHNMSGLHKNPQRTVDKRKSWSVTVT